MDPSKFTLSRIQQMLGLSRTVLSGLIEEGFVVPARGLQNEMLFSFQDLTLLRTAHGLQKASVAPCKILRSLAKLRADLPPELPLTGLRITAVGSDVVVRDRASQWHVESGQLLIDFEIAPSMGGSITPLAKDEAPTREDAEAYFLQAASLDDTDAVAAEQAYRVAIELDPACVDAYVNLGALLCRADRSRDAVTLYVDAVQQHPGHALLHYNHAVALEDQALPVEALAAYRRALVADPELADAHFNAARLLQEAGDLQGTLRHFSAYRRLQANVRS